MLLFIQCIVLCAVFTLLILPPLFKNPLSQIVSYPPAIRKRVENLPQKYRDVFAKTRNKNILKKIIGAAITVFLAAGKIPLRNRSGKRRPFTASANCKFH